MVGGLEVGRLLVVGGPVLEPWGALVGPGGAVAGGPGPSLRPDGPRSSEVVLVPPRNHAKELAIESLLVHLILSFHHSDSYVPKNFMDTVG